MSSFWFSQPLLAGLTKSRLLKLSHGYKKEKQRGYSVTTKDFTRVRKSTVYDIYGIQNKNKIKKYQSDFSLRLFTRSGMSSE